MFSLDLFLQWECLKNILTMCHIQLAVKFQMECSKTPQHILIYQSNLNMMDDIKSGTMNHAYEIK